MNADNESFHIRDGISGIQRGVQFKSVANVGGEGGAAGDHGQGPQAQQEDWRVGLTGAEIMKERRRRQRRRRKQKAKGEISGEELLSQLMTLRAIEPQTDRIATKKAKIKKELRQRGVSY